MLIWDERLTGDDPITVQFGTKQAKVTIYDPTVGVAPVKTLADARSLDLSLSNHPLILMLQ